MIAFFKNTSTKKTASESLKERFNQIARKFEISEGDLNAFWNGTDNLKIGHWFAAGPTNAMTYKLLDKINEPYDKLRQESKLGLGQLLKSSLIIAIYEFDQTHESDVTELGTYKNQLSKQALQNILKDPNIFWTAGSNYSFLFQEQECEELFVMPFV